VEIETKYALKLFFPTSAFVQIYFEAVANAIDANASTISIEVRTDGKIHDPGYLEITIHDDGIGFTDERYERFMQLKEPTDAYHKGLGRLIFLQYFSCIDVESVYGNQKRTFTFVHNFGGSCQLSDATPSDKPGTKITFCNFSNSRVKSYDDLRASTIKQSLLEQFLPALYNRKRSGAPLTITIQVVTDESNPQKEFFSSTETLSENDLPELKSSTIRDTTLHLFNSINVSYSVQSGAAKPLVLTAADIDGRTVPLILLAPTAIPVGTSAIFLFDSDLFTARSDSARQRLVLPEGLPEKSLFRALKQEVGRILSEELPAIKTRNDEVKETFENSFPHLIGLFDEDTVGLIDRDEAVEAAQTRFFQKQRQVIESDPTDDAAFQKSLEMSARSLTEYILYRDWVIKRLGQAKAADVEATIHNLIVPRYTRFEHPALIDDVYRNNAWILDDKFMTFRTILSESSMSEVVKAITLDEDALDDDGRPDISMIFSADPNTADRVDVVVVELKRRKVDDKEAAYAGAQLVKRARKLVDHCPTIQRVWYYGIVEIDDELAQLLTDMKWAPLYSKGRVFFQDFSVKRKVDDIPIPTPTFLLSFDAITADAAARNHTFLELLKNNFKRKGTMSAG
jgi:hypothetical protein